MELVATYPILYRSHQYGLSDYLSIKQKYFDEYQKSLSEEK